MNDACRWTHRVNQAVILVLAAVAIVMAHATPVWAGAAGDEYVALVDAYRAGHTRESVLTLSNQDDKWITAEHTAAMKTAASWPAGRLESAVLLHTEVVTGGWVLPAHVGLHLDAARRLLAASRSANARALRHQWLLVVCWHFQSELELGAMVPFLDELRDTFADDPETDLATGSFFEAVGWSSSTPDLLPWTTRSRVLSMLPHHSQQDALDQATTAFERAMRAPALSDEARVRLGHVQVLRGRPQEALTQLQPLVTGAAEKRWRYLAALFSALAEDRLGHVDAEITAYRQASDIAPGCQTPLVGMTAVRRLQGSTADAAALARTLAEGPDNSCDDAWWYYRFGPSPDRIPEKLEQLRKTFAP